MAALRFHLLLLLLLFRPRPLSTLADTEIHSDGELPLAPPKPRYDPALLREFHNLKSQFQDLEEISLEKDLVIHDKDKVISALRVELQSMKKKEILQYDNALNELGSKVSQLEDDLKRTHLELEESRNKANTLEATQSHCSSKIKQLEKVVSEQKKQIAKAEQALHAAESKISRMQQEAGLKDNELQEVHGGWIPLWTSSRLVELQAIAAEHWSKYGQPLVDTTVERASKKVLVAQERTKPYVEKFKLHAQKNWGPAFQRNVESVSATVFPHFETAKSKVLESYQMSKDFVSPQLKKIQDTMEPRMQVARETCRPYVEETASLIRPYYEQVQLLLIPSDKISKGYTRILASATAYHSQLQESMKTKMEKFDFLAPEATSNELVWLLCSALLALPPLFISLFLLSSLVSSKKAVRASKSHHSSHSHKRAKRAKQANK